MHLVFFFKFFLANIALAASLFLIFARSPLLEKPSRIAIIVYYGLRLGILAVLLLGFKFSYPAENMGIYTYYADLVLHGAVPNRDFHMLYGILFPHLLAAAFSIGHHRFALILLFQLVEFAAVYAIFTQKNLPLSLGAFLGFAFNPVVLVWMWLGLQNQVMCLLPAAAIVVLRNETRRSFLFAFGFALSKIFSLWTILPALLCQRIRSVVLFGVALLVIYAPFLLAGSTGISFQATEANGQISDDAGHAGVESWVGLIPAGPSEVRVTHAMLLITAALLLVVILAACRMRFRLGLGTLEGDTPFHRSLLFTTIFATLLTLIYQAFATYTAPDYLLVAIVFAPILARARFWTIWDQAFFVVVCYFQAVIYLLWFHLPEFGKNDPRTSHFFLFFLILGNIGTIALCLRCAYRTFTFLARHPGGELFPAI